MKFQNSFEIGIGLRAPHITELLATNPKIGFLEIHAENYFGGGPTLRQLLKLRENYSISCHGVGLSLGRHDVLDLDHLKKLKELYEKIDPIFVSEHLSFSTDGNAHTPDLLPMPLTKEAMATMVRNVSHAQDFLGKKYLIENPSNYIKYAKNDYSEAEFLNELCAQTGCGILLDVNNIAVSAHNLGTNPREYIENINPKYVGEIHLAGYQINTLKGGGTIRIDTHGKNVFADVWELFEYALLRIGPRPTLIEWDSDIPPLGELLQEARKATERYNSFQENDAQYA